MTIELTFENVCIAHMIYWEKERIAWVLQLVAVHVCTYVWIHVYSYLCVCWYCAHDLLRKPPEGMAWARGTAGSWLAWVTYIWVLSRMNESHTYQWCHAWMSHIWSACAAVPSREPQEKVLWATYCNILQHTATWMSHTWLACVPVPSREPQEKIYRLLLQHTLPHTLCHTLQHSQPVPSREPQKKNLWARGAVGSWLRLDWIRRIYCRDKVEGSMALDSRAYFIHHRVARVDTVLQCVAACCSVLQCIAIDAYVILHRVALDDIVLQRVAACCSVLKRITACCSVVRCVAMCCSVLQLTPMLFTTMLLALTMYCRVCCDWRLCYSPPYFSRRHYVDCNKCCSVSQCVVVFYNALQCIAACCSVLQCVIAVCYSV